MLPLQVIIGKPLPEENESLEFESYVSKLKTSLMLQELVSVKHQNTRKGTTTHIAGKHNKDTLKLVNW